jgi:hypothetical protein
MPRCENYRREKEQGHKCLEKTDKPPTLDHDGGKVEEQKVVIAAQAAKEKENKN